MTNPTATPSARRRGRPITVDADGVSSRMRMLFVAEQLFAARGIDAVALREVVQVAGQGNSNAVHYHFGSKEGLLFAIFAHRVAEMEPIRRDMIARARQAGRLDDVRTLLEIFFRPYLDLTDEDGRHSYAAFMAEYLVRFRPAGLKHAGDNPEAHSSTLSEVVRLLGACTRQIPVTVMQNRLELFHLMFFNTIARWDNAIATPDGRPALEDLVTDVINIAAASFLVPEPGTHIE